MKKIIAISLISLIILTLLVTAGVIYLNNVYLPKTIKALIIKGIEEQTDSKVTLGSLKVNIFKGLVLRDLSVYRGEALLLKVKEASCIFFPWSLLEKKIAIPLINLDSAQIFLERRKDNTLNLADLFAPKPLAPNTVLSASAQQTKAPSAKKGFSVLIYRINISNAKVIFQDSTFSKPFVKSLENLNLTLYLSLPASVKFKLSALIPAASPTRISGNGEFKIPAQALNAKFGIVNFSPHEFSTYYADTGLKITEDSFNLSADVKMSNSVFYINIEAQGENFNISRERLSARVSMDLRAILEYSLNNKKFQYSGNSKIYDTDISGVEVVDKIKNISCGIVFNNSGLKTENLSAQIFNLPVMAKATLTNYNDPEIIVSAGSNFSLAALQDILKDKFKFNFPGSVNGEGELSLLIEGKLSEADALVIKANLGIIKAELKLDKLGQPIQGINGSIEFLKDKLHQYPLCSILLNFGDISLNSLFSFNKNLIKVSKCSGRYYLSEFSLAGDIDVKDASRPKVDLTGELLIDLKDLDKALPKFKDQLNKIKPEGKIRMQFNLSGNISKLKDCNIEASLSSDSIFLYGLRGSGLALDYVQEGGVSSIPLAHLSLYGGLMDASFKTNLNSENYPYWLIASLKDVKIEELKLDTRAKAKNISGIIMSELKMDGFLNDLSGSQGVGSISVTKGKLWELDLFKGMGKLMFSQDFANITFSEGKCGFDIKDKSIFTDNLMLNSDMVKLSGSVKIGFDSSIDARLNVDIISEFVPLSGTFKDVTTAIISGAEKFAVIRINGSLKEPKYKFEVSVTDIIKGIAGTLLKRI